MIRHDYSRVDPKRRAHIDPRKRQFAKAEYEQQEYKHRLNFYTLPPTAEITLEEFETWAIARLKGIQTLSLPRLISNKN
jgi:DNA primase large subunit